MSYEIFSAPWQHDASVVALDARALRGGGDGEAGYSRAVRTGAGARRRGGAACGRGRRAAAASCAGVLVRVAEVRPLVAAAGAQLRHAAHPALASGKFEANWVQQAILWVWRGGEWRERACSADCGAPCTRFRLWVGVRRESRWRRTSEASRSCWWWRRSWRPLHLRGGRIFVKDAGELAGGKRKGSMF